MPRTVVLDEWFLTFRIPTALPAAAVRAVRRVLNGKTFIAAVRRAVQTEMHEKPVLKPVRATVAR